MHSSLNVKNACIRYNRVFKKRNTSRGMYEAVHRRSVRFDVILIRLAVVVRHFITAFHQENTKFCVKILQVNLPFVGR